jgi:ATP/maltotriose-dependent transcriptional regulator MalT
VSPAAGKYGADVSVAGGPGVSLIRTKVHGPVPRTMVARPELVARLVRGSKRRLTLVRGQAGWGKSNVLAAWSLEDQRPFAWLSLDRGDNDPVRFFTYLIEALHVVAASVGEASASILRTPGVDVVEDVLPVLINELDAAATDCVLVVEDYHVIGNATIHEAVAYLVDHAPPNLEMVISTRVEPPLPLARLRGRGELLEIATTDLRFSVDDAHTMLVTHQGLDLDQSAVRRLVERTEGWPAGLYLAGLSLAGRARPQEFIDEFAGDDRHVVDYLTTEVLAAQTPEVREFMLATSVLERLCASLCDDVVGGTSSATMLRDIERSNSFLVALDNRREWYRFHHLFRDFLRKELASTDPPTETAANRRAASWLQNRGRVAEAIPHLVAANEAEDAAELIASSWRRFATSGEHETIRTWLELLPPAVRAGDSRLCIASALVSISTGRLDEVGHWIDQAARASAGGPFHDGFNSGTAAANCLRTVHAWLLGDLGACRAAGHVAVDGADEPSPWDAVTYTWFGASQFWLGERTEGLATLHEALKRCSADFRPPWIACLSILGLAHHLQGDDAAADSFAGEALALSAREGLNEYSRLTTAAHIAHAGSLTGRGEPDEARRELQRVVDGAHLGSGPVEIAHAFVALSTAAEAAGDLVAARSFLDDATQVVRVCADPGPVITEVLSRTGSTLDDAPRRSRPPRTMMFDLTEREMSVLRLLVSDLSQREIAAQLYISFNTVKTHSKTIFRKLAVGSREAAVARARELNLIR